ncbi:MAG: Rieske 2Fe-2S domain-containing protein [Actinobacteria bacterium]|nr:MAG: Rieske 2Fe-2S domain-containing protein [Actinomycetota bacterium]
MSTSSVVLIAVAVVLVLGLLFIATTAARRDRAAAEGALSRETRRRDRGNPLLDEAEAEPAQVVTGRQVERAAVLARQEQGGALVTAPAPAPPAVPAYLDEETLAVTRRQFLNRGIVTLMSVSLASFGAAMLGFVWPSLAAGGFGSKIKAGKLDDILSQTSTKREPVYVPEGRFYLQPYPKDAVAKASKVYSGAVLAGMESGVVALYQKCVHLGCRVPWCTASQWFECPCHGSKYNRVGEKKGGPAPRGLDRFAVSVDGGQVVVDTKQVVLGPPIGTDTTGQGLEGPHCA